MKLRFLILLGVLLLFTLPNLAQDDIVIDFYYPTAVEGPIAETIQGYADTFMEAHPGVMINVVYTGSYNQTRDTILAEGDEPIVDVAIMLTTDLYSFVEDGHIIPLQSYIDADADFNVDDFFPALWLNSYISEGSAIWSVPFQRSTPIMFYNADLLAEEGLDVPKNNEELVEVAQALTTEDRWGLMVPVAGIFPSWLFQSFAAAYGQPLVEGDPTQVYFNAPEVIHALEYVTKLGMPVEDGGYGVGPMGGSAWGETPEALTSGNAAMIYHTTGSLTNILANADFEVGVAFLPSGPAGEDGTGYAAPLGGGNLYVFDDGTKTEEELQAAWEWVKFLASPEIQSDWGAATGYIAARESAWELDPLKSLTEEYPQYAVARDQLAYAYKEFSTWRGIETQNLINNQLSIIISGQEPLDQAQAVMDEAQAQADALLEEYR